MNANESLFSTPMQPQEVSVDVLREKYARGDETTVAQVRARVARALAAHEADAMRLEMEQLFLWAQDHGFVPAGRINSAAGLGMKATLMNCFVQPVGDTISGCEAGVPGIYGAVAESAETMRRGGGVGYDFSAIRPAGSLVKGSRARPAPCRTWPCSTHPAAPSNRRARGAGPRWACCASTIPTSAPSSPPRTAARSPTSTSPSA